MVDRSVPKIKIQKRKGKANQTYTPEEIDAPKETILQEQMTNINQCMTRCGLGT